MSAPRSVGVPAEIKPDERRVAVTPDGVRELVDRVGGIGVDLGAPVRDPHTGLELPAGASQLDGADALAWMRSRHLEVQLGDQWFVDASSDTGRQERQRQVLDLLSEGMADRLRNPLAAQQLAWSAAGAVRTDRSTGPLDLVRLASTLRRATERTSLPHELLQGRIPVATLTAEAQAPLDGLRSRVPEGPPCPRPQVGPQ